MQYQLPKRINSEADLKYYENYLIAQNEPNTEIISPQTFEEYLKNYIGKFVNIHCNNRIMIGVIIEVGKDFLILSRSNTKVLIPIKQINSVILPQGNQTCRR